MTPALSLLMPTESPETKLLPVKVTGTVAPCDPTFGVIDVRTGACAKERAERPKSMPGSQHFWLIFIGIRSDHEKLVLHCGCSRFCPRPSLPDRISAAGR